MAHAFTISTTKISARHLYLRLQAHGLDRRWSLRTRDLLTATIAAHEFSARLLNMKNHTPRPHLGWVLESSGKNFKITTEDNDADRKSATEALIIAMQNNFVTTPVSCPSPILNNISITLNEALSKYETDLNGFKIADKTKRQALSILCDLKNLLGQNFNMLDLNDEVVEDRWLPHRLKKVGETTAKRDLSYRRSFVKWSSHRTRKYTPTELTFSIKAIGEHYEYFDKNDLKLIFDNLPTYADKAWKFWIPLIGLYTGGRIGEIASLKTEYFSIKNQIETMYVDGTKTNASPRNLPIHADLIKLGLLEYVNSRRIAKKIMLFDLIESKSNGWANEPSGWFTDYKKQIGLIKELKVFHSFRHTIIDLMNQISIMEKPAAQYTGHSSARDVRSKVYSRNPIALETMKTEVVDKIDFNKYCEWSPNMSLLTAKASTYIK